MQGRVLGHPVLFLAAEDLRPVTTKAQQNADKADNAEVAMAYRSETGSSVRATFDLNLQHRVSMIDMRFRAELALAATRKSSLLIFVELQ